MQTQATKPKAKKMPLQKVHNKHDMEYIASNRPASPMQLKKKTFTQPTTKTPPIQCLKPSYFWQKRSNAQATNQPVNDQDKIDAVNRAVRKLKNVRILNYTHPMHYLFESTESSYTYEYGSKKTNIKRHLVNKWERAAEGEKGLELYNFNVQGYSSPYLIPAATTNNKEADFLKINQTDYKALPPHKKMQFSMFDLKHNGGFGNSAFVIKKSKAKKDGRIHFGDSGFDGFGGGSIKYFDGNALKNYLMVCDIEKSNSIISDSYTGWIEINYSKGVYFPNDIDKLIIDPEDYRAMQDHLSKKLNFVLPERELKNMLNGWLNKRFSFSNKWKVGPVNS